MNKSYYTTLIVQFIQERGLELIRNIATRKVIAFIIVFSQKFSFYCQVKAPNRV